MRKLVPGSWLGLHDLFKKFSWRNRDLFKKIWDTKGIFHTKMGKIKNRNIWTEQKQNVLRRGGKNTQKNCTKKKLHDADKHNGVIMGLEPGIPECEIKWAWGSFTTNKASGGDGITINRFQILKDDAVKVLHSICQQIWMTQQWSQDWRRLVFIPIPRKGKAKECSNYLTTVLISHASKVMLKILQARFQQYMNCELPDVQAGFRKSRGTRD